MTRIKFNRTVDIKGRPLYREGRILSVVDEQLAVLRGLFEVVETGDVTRIRFVTTVHVYGDRLYQAGHIYDVSQDTLGMLNDLFTVVELDGEHEPPAEPANDE